MPHDNFIEQPVLARAAVLVFECHLLSGGFARALGPRPPNQLPGVFIYFSMHYYRILVYSR